MRHRFFVVLLVGAMLAFGVAGSVMVMRMRSRAAAAQAAQKVVPRFEVTGGVVVELEVDGAAGEVEKMARLAASALQRRLDPDGTRGVEVLAEGQSIMVRVPVPGGLSSDAREWLRQFSALGVSGLWDEARRVSLLAGSPGRLASDYGRAEVEAVVIAHPEREAAMRELAAASSRIKATGGVEDPVWIVEMAVRPGALECRIAVEDATRNDGVVWMPLHRPEAWAHYGMPDQEQTRVAEFNADPEGYLRKMGYTVRVQEGSVSMLLGNTSQDSLTSDQAAWRVQSVGQQSDILGRPQLFFQLNSAGGQLMEAMTGPNIERHMAVIVDGEVYSAPRLKTAIGAAGLIEGQFDAREMGVLLGELRNPLPGKVRVVGVQEDRRGP